MYYEQSAIRLIIYVHHDWQLLGLFKIVRIAFLLSIYFKARELFCFLENLWW